MEYQISNEISAFWFDLVPPIFLGTISLSIFLWVIGKDYRHRIMKLFVYSGEGQYIKRNGIIMSKSQTIEYAFCRKLLNCTGLEALKPIIVLFLIFLFFYGLDFILLMTFQPLLTTRPDGILFAAGVEDHVLATIWMHYPSEPFTGIYQIILNLTETPNTHPVSFLDSIRTYIQFDLFCSIILISWLTIKRLKLFFSKRRCPGFKRAKLYSYKKVSHRLFLIICILFVLLVCTLLAEIYVKNDHTIQKCNQAYHILMQDSPADSTSPSGEVYRCYLEKVHQQKEQASKYLFYGAYGITTRWSKPFIFILDVFAELFRFFQYRVNSPS